MATSLLCSRLAHTSFVSVWDENWRRFEMLFTTSAVRHVWKLGLVCAVALLLPFLSFAQTSKGILAGTVVDSSGAVVVSASVTARNVQTGTERTTTTGPNGGYRMEAVEPGLYKVTV